MGVLLAVCATTLLGQQPPSPQPRTAQPPLVFRAGVEAVQIDVFVTDEHDRPVTDLTVNDFEVFENDRSQVITTFAPVNIPLERRESLPLAAESDVQSNDREHRHVYLILLSVDDANAALRSRYVVRRFLTEYFGDNDVAAVVAAGALRTQDGQDFTSNKSLLLAALDKYSGGDRIVSTPRNQTKDFWDLMEVMARIPGGRKSVLLFGNIQSLDAYRIMDYRGGVMNLDGEYAHAGVAAATQANIRIYPIDPSGVVAGGTGSPGFPGNAGLPGPDARALAALTGGVAHTSGNDYPAFFERLVRETSTFYVLGFDSTIRRKEGRHISLEVKVKRPGLNVRARTGYVEQLEYIRANMPPESKRTPVETALANPLSTTGVTMRVTAASFRQSGRTSTVALAVEVDPETLQFTQRNGRFLATLEIRHVVTDSRAKIYPEYRHRGSLDLDALSYRRLTQSGIRVVSQLDLPEGRYQVRVASARGTRNGSVVYDLIVPDFTDDPFAMSGVAITTLAAANAVTFRPDRYQREKQTGTECRERVCESGAAFGSVLVPYAARVAPSEKPLLSDVLPAPPDTTRAFTPSDTLALFTEVYDNAKSDRKDPPYAITLTASLHDTESIVVRQVSEDRDSKATRRKSGGHGFTLKLPLEGIAPGSYVLRVEASSSRSEQHRVSRSIPIRVR
jgi:VWFA-related protein